MQAFLYEVHAFGPSARKRPVLGCHTIFADSAEGARLDATIRAMRIYGQQVTVQVFDYDTLQRAA